MLDPFGLGQEVGGLRHGLGDEHVVEVDVVSGAKPAITSLILLRFEKFQSLVEAIDGPVHIPLLNKTKSRS